MTAPVTWSIAGTRRPLPTPDGTPLVFEVSCPSRAGGRHEVTLDAQWQLDTPHDLVAEKVLAAFGGSSPCAQLAKACVAGRAWLELELRHALPRLRREGERVFPVPQTDCCPYGLPLDKAARHARADEHLAAVHDVDRAQLREVVEALATAYGIRHDDAPHPDEVRAVQHCVNPPTAVGPLWDLGLSPQAIRRIYDAVNKRAWVALPRRLYEAVVVQRPDLKWLEHTLSAPEVEAPTPDDAVALTEWLVSTSTELDRRHPEARRKWLATRLPWHWILTLSEAGYTADDLMTLVNGTRLTAIGCANVLARWACAGCHPAPEELLKLAELGLGYSDQHVSKPVLDRLRGLLAMDGIALSDTQLGLLFVAAGSAVMAHQWVRAGVADPCRLAELIADGESPRSIAQRRTQPA